MAAMLELEFGEALERLRSGPNSEWEKIAGEFDGEIWPEVEPGFKLQAGQTVFTIGSCFARTIEDHLARLGCRTRVWGVAHHRTPAVLGHRIHVCDPAPGP